MGRKFKEKEIFIASGNKGKIIEIEDLLKPFNIKIKSTKDLDVEEPEETEDSFAGNAKLKSDYYCKHSGIVSLSDDSGLEVDALNGAPGIYSARWAGDGKDFDLAMQLVKEALEDIGYEPEKMGYNNQLLKANFTCALSLTWPDGHSETFTGKVHGFLTFPPKGDNGFGYDPIFVKEGMDITFAEMEPQAKHAISHRAIAFDKLIRECFS